MWQDVLSIIFLKKVRWRLDKVLELGKHIFVIGLDAVQFRKKLDEKNPEDSNRNFLIQLFPELDRM